jgi:uncharacterized Zn-finger protein
VSRFTVILCRPSFRASRPTGSHLLRGGTFPTQWTMTLTPAKIADLERLENIIEKGKKTFIEVGNALQQIQLFKLYQRDYDTWEAYCQGRWGFTRQRANQIMHAAEIVQSLPQSVSTTVDISGERAAREIVKLPVDNRAAVVHEASRNGSVTGPSVRRAAEKIINADPPSKPEIPVDEMGFPLPEVSIPFWNRRDEIQSLMSHVSAVRGALKHYQDDKDQMLCDLHNALSQQLATVYLSLSDRKPYAVCPYCDGTFEYKDEYGRHDCKACHQTGLMAKALYDKVPPQFRARREKALK